MIYAVYKVEWTEYERGWGQRPDGTSYHKSKEDAIKYIQEYDKKYNNEPSAPDCYTKGGSPHLAEVDKKLYNKVMKEGVVWK